MNIYDYCARNYDPALGRWFNIDPLAEKYYKTTPYNYAANNPLVFKDIDGRDIIFVINNQSFNVSKDILMKTEQGKALWDKYANSKTDDVYISFQKFNNNFDKAATGTNAQGTSLTNKNKFNISGNEGYENFSSFEGVDISRSKNKNIHLILLLFYKMNQI